MDDSRPESPHVFPANMPFLLWAFFQISCAMYAALILLGFFNNNRISPQSQLFVAYFVGSGAVACAILAGLLTLFMRPQDETDPARFVGRFVIRLVLQLLLLEAIAIMGVCAKAFGLDRSVALVFVAGGLFGMASLFPYIARGVTRIHADRAQG